MKARRLCRFLGQERGRVAVRCGWLGAGAPFLEQTAKASSLSLPNEWEAAEVGFPVHQELQAQAVTLLEKDQGFL